MVSKYQLMIDALYKIPIGNVTKLMPDFFDNGKYVRHYENFQLYLRLGFKFDT